MPDLSHLTARAREVYAIYLDAGKRDIDATASLAGMHPAQVQAMADRYGFVELATDSDITTTMAMVAYTRRRIAERLPVFADTLIDSAASRTTNAGHAPGSAPTPAAVKAALAGLAMFGLSPLTRSDIGLLRLGSADSEHGGARPDDAMVARLVASGDIHALTTLAAGRMLPAGQGDAVPRDGVAPRDFTSDQPGGRVGSDPLTPLFQAEDADYRVISDEEWQGEQAEFAFGEQPAEEGDSQEAETERRESAEAEAAAADDR